MKEYIVGNIENLSSLDKFGKLTRKRKKGYVVGERFKDNAELVKKLESQFRKTSRQMIQLETEEETLHYLVDSFKTTIACDFVGIILKNNGQYEPRIWGGQFDQIIHSFPVKISDCSEFFMVTSMYKNEYETSETCAIHHMMEASQMSMWFTVPLVHEENQYGFCLIGYHRPVELLNMEHIFNEFGKDVALAIKLIRERKQYIALTKGLDWITNHHSPNSSISTMVRELTKRAAKTTQSQFAAIYLYNESSHTYDLQPSMYGDEQIPTSLKADEHRMEEMNFQKIGHLQLMVSIRVDDQLLGLLYVSRKDGSKPYEKQELHLAQLIGNHFAMLIQNALHIKNEREQKERLQKLLQYQQHLVKNTIVHDDFDSVTKMVFDIYRRPVLVFDRFFRVLSSNGIDDETELSEFVAEMKQSIFAKNVFQLYLKEERVFSIWPIYGVRDLLGYLAIGVNEQLFDEFDQLTIELASNISSIQFIKKKLVFDANEQMKDTFLAKLFTNPVGEEEHLIQYASLFHWDIFSPHRVAQISLELEKEDESDLLTVQSEKMYIWEQMNIELTEKFPKMLMSTYNDQFLLIVPLEYEYDSKFWDDLHKKCTSIVTKLDKRVYLRFGIGQVVTETKDYATSYQQAVEALNVLKTRFAHQSYMFFEQLGSYMILHNLDERMSEWFVAEQLKQLFEYEEDKNIDLWNTLKVYLLNNGNVKVAAEQLFIHRSTLIYRLQKIEQLIGKDLTDADVRFDLMMAIKLLEMKGKWLFHNE